MWLFIDACEQCIRGLSDDTKLVSEDRLSDSDEESPIENPVYLMETPTAEVADCVQVSGVVESAGEHVDSKEYIARIKAEYPMVLSQPQNARDIPVELRGPYGIARIELRSDARPVKKKFFRLAGDREFAMEGHIDKLISRGWIEPAVSEWAAQAFLVPKPLDTKKPGEKQWRMVVDYRFLNAQTKDDPFPLPLIEDLLH